MKLKEKFTTMVLDKEIADWEKVCEQIADTFAIEFALFLSENMYENMYNDINKDGKTWVSYLQDGFHEHTQAERFTIQEILEIFKKEKKL